MRRVNWFRTIFVLAVLAVWVPASSHALLEHAELIHNHEAEHHHTDGESHDHGPVDARDHDAADGICRVELHTAKAPSPVFAIAFLLPDSAVEAAPALIVERPEHSGPSPPGAAPPQPSGPRAPPLA